MKDITINDQGDTIIYARSATRASMIIVNQGQYDNSIGGQINRCIALAEARGYKVRRTISGVGSGYNLIHTGFQSVLREVGTGGVKRVIVSDYSRITRNHSLLTEILADLRLSGVEVVSVQAEAIPGPAILI